MARAFLPRSLLVALALACACADENPNSVENPISGITLPLRRIISSTGTVVYSQAQAGYGIIDDTGPTWDADVPDSLAIDSLRVSFRGVPLHGDPDRTWGPMRLTEIQIIADPPPINLEPFRELARNAHCADIRHRLFLIDRKYVLWDRVSNCADLRFVLILYGRTIDDEICSASDSIGGPRSYCRPGDPRPVSVLHSIVGSLDDPYLGLGPVRVEPVDF